MSLTVAVRYLMGRAMATSASSWDQAEWPPHPDRFFQALVATHFEGDPTSEERSALEWLEAQEAPEIHCSQANQRSVVTHFVPVNDVKPPRLKGGKALSETALLEGLQTLPDYRLKQPRVFPVAVPDHDTVYFRWKDGPAPQVREGLASLCSNLTRLGHSSSLVWSWLTEYPKEGLAHLKPSPRWEFKLRTPRAGRLRLLEQAHTSGLRSPMGAWTGYREAGKLRLEVPSSHFDPNLLVLKARPDPQHGRARVGVEDTLKLAEAVRNTLMSRLGERGRDIPEALSGHLPDGAPTEQAHIAVLPLPHVGREHADGHLLGMALAFPKDSKVGKTLGNVLEEPLRLHLGYWGVWHLQHDTSEWLEESLRSRTWSAPPRGAEAWATVTPIVLDKHLKTKIPNRLDRAAYALAMAERSEEIASSIIGSCERIGLPKPRRVEVFGYSLFEGAPSVREYPRLNRHKQSRFHTHAYLEFEEPVRGPILLGSGRYRGYGLCRPYEEKGVSDEK